MLKSETGAIGISGACPAIQPSPISPSTAALLPATTPRSSPDDPPEQSLELQVQETSSKKILAHSTPPGYPRLSPGMADTYDCRTPATGAPHPSAGYTPV